jgi:malic enzyme
MRQFHWLIFFAFYHSNIAEALAKQVSEENYAQGLIYPPFTNIRKISAHIAAHVAAKAYELGKFLHSTSLSVILFQSHFK